jgi:formylglycine-generating enzyme required for sulfatase activity
MEAQTGAGMMDIQKKSNTENKPSCCIPRPLGTSAIAPAEASPVTSSPEQNTPHQKIDPDPKTIPMVFLPGGNFLMGTDYARGFPADGEGPVRPVTLSPFEIDAYPVTNADFAAFVAATKYRTEAERFGWSFVFWMHIPEERFDALVEDTVAQAPWWCKVLKARWNQPEGPGSSIDYRLDHPVVHVSWNDAQAYARWGEKSLPTEAQWEYAARGGLEQKLYPWGDDLTPQGQHRCNIWQGQFPNHDTAEDGYSGTCPVDSFPPNGHGLYSVTGNVWEWCADWFGFPSAATASPLRDPSGPPSGQVKVMKGGSFLCHASYCNRYRVAARTSNTPDSSASNIGFRCVRNAAVKPAP